MTVWFPRLSRSAIPNHVMIWFKAGKLADSLQKLHEISPGSPSFNNMAMFNRDA